MYLLFLAVGVVVGAAGIVLAISSLSLRDGTFDAAVFTPGVVTAIGGFLVVGLGLGLRTLQRIEQALASRPTLHASLSGATADTAETDDVPRQTARVFFPRKAGRSSQPTAASSVPGLGNDSDDLEEQPADSAFVVDKITPFLPPIAIAAANEGNPDSDAQRVGKQGNETAAPQLPMGMRSATLTERPNGPTFDSLWPEGPRPIPSAPGPPASTQAPAVSAADSQKSTDQSIDVTYHAEGSLPVSILKSGVINGMAYILYSDGSIEAQLPEGTLRFGSITELRNHIERSA
jgi:hypothetical protein